MESQFSSSSGGGGTSPKAERGLAGMPAHVTKIVMEFDMKMLDVADPLDHTTLIEKIEYVSYQIAQCADKNFEVCIAVDRERGHPENILYQIIMSFPAKESISVTGEHYDYLRQDHFSDQMLTRSVAATIDMERMRWVIRIVLDSKKNPHTHPTGVTITQIYFHRDRPIVVYNSPEERGSVKRTRV